MIQLIFTIMKKVVFLTTLIGIFLGALFTGCRPDKPEQQQAGDVLIRVYNKVGNEDIVYGQYNYTNAAGNKYRVNLLKYYLSNFVFVQDNGAEYKADNYELIDAFDSTTCYLQFKGIPPGNYTHLKFALGIDSLRNHTGLQEGDLDPIHGMIWSWSTGYIFFKHEGQFKDSNMVQQQLFYHYGTDLAYTPIMLPLPFSGLRVEGLSKKINLLFDLNKLYSTPNVVNFNNNNIHESLSVDDHKWITQLRENFPNAFNIQSIE